MTKEEQANNAEDHGVDAEAEAVAADATVEKSQDAGVEPGSEIEQLQAQLEQSQDELAGAKDQMVRALADAQNTRRRADKDVSSARLYALESFSKDLLPVIDNLERAMDSATAGDEAVKAIAEGVELTLKSFKDVLKSHHEEQLNPLSEPFDPEFHQAISMVPNQEVEPNTVLDVVQKGYTLNGRLIRPAMVVVSS